MRKKPLEALAVGVLALTVVALALLTERGGTTFMGSPAPPKQDRLLFFRVGYSPEGFITVNLDGTDERVLASLEEQRATYLYDGTQMHASPDGRYIAWSNGTGPGPGGWYPERSGLWVMNWDSTGKRRLVQGGRQTAIIGAAWSPDGKRIAYGREAILPTEYVAELHVVNADGTGDRLITNDRLFSPWKMRWVSHDEIIWEGARDESYYINVTTKEIGAIAPKVDSAYYSVSPDGKRVAIMQNVLPEQIQKPGLVIEKIPAPRWSPDGTAVAYGNLLYKNLITGVTINVLEVRCRTRPPCSPVGVSPDNRNVLFWNYDGLNLVNIRMQDPKLIAPASSQEGKAAYVDFIDWIRGRKEHPEP